MRKDFLGYYKPTQEDFKEMWEHGLIVLDTNVLLDLYKLPAPARDESIAVLEKMKNRLWIPHQVALEFQRNRLGVISNEQKIIKEALKSTLDSLNNTKQKVNILQLDKRDKSIDSKKFIEDLDKANTQIIDAIKKIQSIQIDISASDPVREKLDILLEGRIGPGPANQQELDKLIGDGEERFREKIPPGFLDAEKEKNPSEAVFIFDHIRYPRKFGDLILWKQLINYTKEKNTKSVLLITGDMKDDWWWRERGGKTIGPHAELIREIYRLSSVQLFWMYSFAQFIEYANTYISAEVSKQSVTELKQVTRDSDRPPDSYKMNFLNKNFPNEISNIDALVRSNRAYLDPHIIENLVKEWLKERGIEYDLQFNSGAFPDLIARNGEELHGYEIKTINRFDQMLFPPNVINALLRGYMEVKEERISIFTLILIIPENDYRDILFSDYKNIELKRKLGRLLNKYPVHSILIGSIIDNYFNPLMYQNINDKFDSKNDDDLSTY